MSVTTFDGIVEDGQIRLTTDVRLPDQTRVYVIVPDLCVESASQIVSPRLAHPEQSTDFAMEIVEDAADASV